jgi:hypothetical protein
MTSIVSWCSGACYPLSRSPERLIGPSPTGSLLDVKWKPSRSSLSRRLTKIGSPSEERSRRRRMHRAVRTPSTRLSLSSRALAGHRPCTCEGATSGRPGTRGVNQSTALQSLRHLSRSVDSLTPHIPCHWPILYRAPVLGGMRVCGRLNGTRTASSRWTFDAPSLSPRWDNSKSPSTSRSNRAQGGIPKYYVLISPPSAGRGSP